MLGSARLATSKRCQELLAKSNIARPLSSATAASRRPFNASPSSIPNRSGCFALQAPVVALSLRSGRTGLRHYSAPIGKIDKPTYQLSFTCKVCHHRSAHLVSKQAYHSGTVLIQCPSCTNRHLIADHLNVFGQGKKTLEDILKEKGAGEVVNKKTIDLNQLGDIEWEGPGELPEQIKLEKQD